MNMKNCGYIGFCNAKELFILMSCFLMMVLLNQRCVVLWLIVNFKNGSKVYLHVKT